MSDDTTTPLSATAKVGISGTQLIAVLAALMYFTGTIHRSYLFEFFGIPSDAIAQSIQQTMAAGYSSLLDFFVIPLIGAIIAVAITLAFRKTRKGAGIATRSALRNGLIRAVTILFYGLFFLGIGWGAGFSSAQADFSRLAIRTAAGCSRCFLYATTRGRVVAIPLAQDDKTAILVTRRGVAILPAGSIKAIRPIRGREPLPWYLFIH